MVTRNMLVFGTALALLGGAVQPAHADPIRYDFAGVVRSTFGSAPQAVGDLFTGALVIDTDLLPTTEQGPGFRRFEGPVDLRVSFQSAATGQTYLSYVVPQTNLVVNNDIPYDAFRAGVFDPARPTSPVFGFYFTDRNGTALSSTNLPRSIDPRAFDDWRMFYGNYFRSDWRTEGYIGQFGGLVTSLNGIEALTGNPESPAAAPEPSTLLLTAVGIAAGVRRRRSAHS
jgi:hypothetical protein